MISFITPTHNMRYISETYKSLLKQTDKNWEWVVVRNGEALRNTYDFVQLIEKDARVKLMQLPSSVNVKSIGAIKQWSFFQGTKEYLAELDHDDLLVPTAVEDLVRTFKETNADFVYSNTADFFPDGSGHWYGNWEKNGWRYRDADVEGKWYNECISFDPSAAALSLIYYAPNHIRCWKKDFYKKLGGHDPNYLVCDDHELCIRTYLKGKMHHLNKLLYLYRMGEQNTFSKNLETIRNLTYTLYYENIEKLIAREAELRGYPIFDLTRSLDSPANWNSINTQDAEVIQDLNGRWPFEDSSVLAFRAHDTLARLSDKSHVMSEIYRCLKPGGWALLEVPSTDSRGAFMDPTNKSYWNENSFWYYTYPEYAKDIRNHQEHFIEQRLFTYFQSTWHEENKISHTKAELMAIKGNMVGLPGFRRF